MPIPVTSDVSLKTDKRNGGTGVGGKDGEGGVWGTEKKSVKEKLSLKSESYSAMTS